VNRGPASSHRHRLTQRAGHPGKQYKNQELATEVTEITE
jgi:hypothetical protein